MLRLQRQLVDKRVWRELISFFPKAIAFKADVSECLECQGQASDEQRARAAVKRTREQEIALPVLRALYNRKSGVRGRPARGTGSSSGCVVRVLVALLRNRCLLSRLSFFLSDEIKFTTCRSALLNLKRILPERVRGRPSDRSSSFADHLPDGSRWPRAIAIKAEKAVGWSFCLKPS